ncbi:MAG TPA: VOC family protein [Pyrinomonadaceae bacterium]|jgi:catechol 2,3-dioxygenase-like lactoylglutathione lyase family enzyme|nr:VOC family protein [Pyrinomonadaceae bacterium]
MLNNSDVVAFVATSRPESAKSFYEQTLGLRLVSDDAFAIVFDAHGVMLRIQKVQGHTPPPYTVLGWDVTDIHASVNELLSRGVRCERYEWLEQDEPGIWSAPSGAKIAWFKDPDGNTLSLTQFP